MLQVSDEEIKKRLAFDNPWWNSDSDRAYRYSDLPKRFYFEPFYELVYQRELNRAIVLLGPRRVGKTVLVHHAIFDLLDEGVRPENVLYLSLETPVYTGLGLEKLLNIFIDMKGHEVSSPLYIFFDEIQYLKEWEVHLKSLVDSYPDIRFVATGSAAAALRLKSIESGAGRFTEFVLPPLTFAEYLNFIERDNIIEKRENETGKYYACNDMQVLNEEFINYLNYGGYPEAVFSRIIQENTVQFIKSDIIEKVLLRDLPSLYGIQDIQELNRLFTFLAYNTGNEISIDGLSKTSGVAKNTIRRYLEYLEAAFLIRRVNRVDVNARKLKRITSFKVYLTNPAMRAALFGNVEDSSDAMGSLVETALFSQWMHSDAISQLYYARWQKGEVDIVYLDRGEQVPRWCVEVKWSDRPVNVASEIKPIVDFYQNHVDNLNTEPTVTTKTFSGEGEYYGVNIRFVPAAELIYTVGRNILNERSASGVSRP